MGVDVAIRMEAMIADVVEVMGEAEDAEAQVMLRYTMTMGISLLIL